MKRQALMDAIMKLYEDSYPAAQQVVLQEALKQISSDSNLVALAIDLGIDTNGLFRKEGL